MPTPTAEKPPKGLDAYWLGVWRHALKVLKDQGSWAWEQRPLLDEYVFALMAARDCREGFGWLDRLNEHSDIPESAWSDLKQIASGLPTQWDRHTKRASALADQLQLTARGRKAAAVARKDDNKPKDPFADLDGLDEVTARRRARSR